MPDAEHRLVEIGAGVDDRGVLAAHLADDLLHVGLIVRGDAGGLQDVEAHRHRSGERDDRGPHVADQRRTDRLPGAGEEHAGVGRAAGLEQDLVQDLRDARRLLRRFHDAGVSADQRGGGHAGADREREVPGTDHHRHAAWLVHDLVDLADEPTQPARIEESDRLPCVELAEVDGLADVGVRFGPGLAALADDDPAQFVAASSHDPRGPDQHRGPFADRRIAPGGEGGVGPVDRPGGVGFGAVVRDGRHHGVADGAGEGLSLVPGCEVPHRFGEERPAVTDGRVVIRQGVAFGSAFDPSHAGVGGEVEVRRREKRRGVGVVHESRAEPRLVRRVLEQPADEVRHAGDHLADRDVFADAEAHLVRGLLQFGGHAVEHLQFEGGLRKIRLLELGDRGRDGSGVVAAEGELHAAFLGGAGRGVDEGPGHPFEAGVRVGLPAPHRDGPSHLLGVDRLVVPVGALDQSHRDLSAGSLRPLDDPGGVVVAGTQIGLHRESGGEVDLLAASHEEFEGQVLERELLHVEVDQDALLLRLQEQWPQGFDQAVDRSFGVDRIRLGVERADLDRDVGAGDHAEMVSLQSLVHRPRVDRIREVRDEIHVLRPVGLGLLVGDARLAEEIDAEREAPLPELPKHRERIRGVGAGDELLRHAGDLLRHRLREHGLRDAAGLDREVHSGRGGDAGLGEVVDEMVVDLVGRPKHRKGVDEPEQLDLERLVLHRPVHELVGPERGVEQSGLAAPGQLEVFRADLQDATFDRGVGGGDRPAAVGGDVGGNRHRRHGRRRGGRGLASREKGHSTTSPSRPRRTARGTSIVAEARFRVSVSVGTSRRSSPSSPGLSDPWRTGGRPCRRPGRTGSRPRPR